MLAIEDKYYSKEKLVIISKSENYKSQFYNFSKTIFDISFSILGIVLLLPLFLLIALVIRIESRGPVLFKQKRYGKNNKEFIVYKFRTMCNDAEAKKDALRIYNEQDGPAFKITGDPRITKFGLFLRKSSLDELPQLFNILKGEMSIVGPRPLDSKEACQLPAWQLERHRVKPGLTCFWQVETRNTVTFDQWMMQDLRYLREKSIFTDLKLIMKTFGVVIRMTGK